MWASESADFTPWLAENLDVLGEELGMSLTLVGVEVPVGEFRLDIQAETTAGGVVIIENQLDRTDHGHLGQLLAYASGLEATAVVWIAPVFREDHRRTLDWLNERTDRGIDFFAVEVGVVQIGSDGPRAPVFTVVARPNTWQKEIKTDAGGHGSGSGSLNAVRQEFFLEVLREFAETHPIRVPAKGNLSWLAFASGPWGNWDIAVGMGQRLRVEAYIDTGRQDVNKALFDELAVAREGLESRIGFPLSWERLDDKRACRIAVYRDPEDLEGEGRSRAREWAVRTLTRMFDELNETLRKRGRELRDEIG